jgi:hypothetical protein
MLPNTRGWSVAGGGHVRSHGKRAEEILKGANYATLFAYLWRRFGPPTYGWDDHKELVCYYLTTPLRGVGFGLSCNPCGIEYSVSYAISPGWAKKVESYERGRVHRWMQGLYRHCLCDRWAICTERWPDHILHEMVSFCGSSSPDEDSMISKAGPSWQNRVRRLVREYTERAGPRPRPLWVDETTKLFGPPIPTNDLPHSPHRRILEAIDAGVRDLLTPVNVRDVYINACGEVPDEDVPSHALRPSPRAGCGCSPDFIDAGDNWWDLSDRIRKIGVKNALNKLS